MNAPKIGTLVRSYVGNIGVVTRHYPTGGFSWQVYPNSIHNHDSSVDETPITLRVWRGSGNARQRRKLRRQLLRERGFNPRTLVEEAAADFACHQNSLRMAALARHVSAG